MKTFVLAFIFIFFFSFYSLGTDMFNVDAQHWILRSSNFAQSMLKGDFAKTYQDPKPGVPVMFLSGFSFEAFLKLYELKYGFRPQFYTYDTFPYLNFVLKAPLVMLNMFFLFFFFYLLKNIFNKNIALLAVILLGLQPFYLANSRFLHVDITLTIFMNLCFLTYLYALKFSKNKFFFLSGFFAGLALLTKTQALFLIPLISLSSLVFSYLYKSNYLLQLKYFFKWFLTFILSYFLFFPAFWVNGKETFVNIFKEAFFVMSTGNTSIYPFYQYFLYLVKDLSFVGFLITFVSVIYILYKGIKDRNDNKFLFFMVFAYVFFYFIQMTIIKQKIDRYMLPMFPMLSLSVSIFLLNNSYLTRLNINEKIISFSLILMFCVNLYYAPHYSAFAIKNFSDNYSGALMSEAAKYINSKPNPYELKVVSMTKVSSLRPFVKGKTFGHEETLPSGWSPEFIVTNDFWLEKYGKPRNFNTCKKEHTVIYRGVKYWDIYGCK